MAKVEWDRLLETCIQRKATDILLVPGSPPLLRVNDKWRPLVTPDLKPDALAELAAAKLGPEPTAREFGYFYVDFTFHDSTRFRLMTFGHPTPTLLVVSRYPEDGHDTGTPPASAPHG